MSLSKCKRPVVAVQKWAGSPLIGAPHVAYGMAYLYRPQSINRAYSHIIGQSSFFLFPPQKAATDRPEWAFLDVALTYGTTTCSACSLGT